MPADNTLSQEPSAHHGDGNAPYKCSAMAAAPLALWSIDFGYCRTSLDWHGEDSRIGHGDPRCPASCRNKAPAEAAIGFGVLFTAFGAAAAAEWARLQRVANEVDEAVK